jgi:peptidoglycan/LPS O-acetylase OafA/YrhL
LQKRRGCVKRREVLDSLKGLAIIGIFCIHVGINHNLFTGYFSELFRFGNLGVEITYIVNGILLANKYYGNYEGQNYPFKLLLNNIMSIIPIYWTFILCLMAIYRFIYYQPIQIGATISSLFFMNVIKSEWANYYGGALYFSCLVIVWIFYLLYMKYVKSIKKSIVCGLIILLATVWLLPEIGASCLDYLEFQSFNYLCRCVASFTIGNIIYFILLSDEIKNINISKPIKMVVTSFLLCVILFRKFTNSEFYGIVSLIILLNYDNPVVLLNNPVLNYLGKRTLPIFACHILVYSVLDKFMVINGLYFIAVIVITLILSEVLYRVDSMRRKLWRKILTTKKENIIYEKI